MRLFAYGIRVNHLSRRAVDYGDRALARIEHDYAFAGFDGLGGGAVDGQQQQGCSEGAMELGDMHLRNFT